MYSLINQLQKRDEQALREVINRYGGYVKAIVIKVLQPNQTAIEECINDVFLTIWQKSIQFTGDEIDFKKWIGVIAKYKAIDTYRSLQNKPKTVELLPSISNSKDLPESIIEQRVQKEQLFISILNLSKNDQEIFLLKYYLGYSNGEIAELFGLSKSAVENRLYRGKLKLIEELGGI
ncbi:sigma-70 family RNA polymerase sigma factor [Lysinibacillus boronitolerans]|uniref:RNA polymerase factor sigma-70 n=1 Tax=Lysinibacillus boronitolerans JCM 21713 = 10a = NBRC 103108 TaxID=1294264 RepID=A0ABR4Y413_9BACI|nr:sigma-70 family RNA polymerase sigma factor [Lysinibacillus boronitolerans]KGR88759.1 RNA polymerase factor sigma-70 [Lysinibacillus boronitolerans JCM 21713 = 10a = NBRC 103108]